MMAFRLEVRGTPFQALRLLLLAILCASLGFGQEPPGPAVAPNDLLQSVPFDRITLTDGAVLIVDPVSPRPLPPYDPSKDKDRERRNPFRPPAAGNIGVPVEKEKAPRAVEGDKDRALDVPVHLLQGGDPRDFKVKRANIRRIEYFEDLLLAEADRWLRARDYERAFECCLRVQSRQPAWPGLDEEANKIVFAEGTAALAKDDGQDGLRLLRALAARQPNYPGLADKLAEAHARKVNRAFDLGLYARGRALLVEGEALAPGNATLREARERFVHRARERVREASQASGTRRLDLLTEALQVWPALEDAPARYAEAFAAEPTLDVAVADVPRDPGPIVRDAADERVARLLYLPLLAGDDEDGLLGKRPGQVLAAVEAADVGRRLTLRVRPGIAWSDGARTVAAADVAEFLIARAEPTAPQFLARWADVLDRVEVLDPSRVEVRLNRSLLKPGAWLLAPIGPAQAGWDGRVATRAADRALVGDGPFRLEAADPQGARFRAATPGGPRIKRLREFRHARGQAALGALMRGEVSLVEHVPPDRVATLAAHPELKVGKRSRPVLHRIALDGRNPILGNRTLRRGLALAIDRRALLEETLLKHPADGANLVSDGPFLKGSYADAPDVKPLEYDPLRARMLVAAARKELGGSALKLTLEYPALPEPQAVVPKLVAALAVAGIEVNAVERPESDLETELRAGRRFDLAYRATRGDEPVTDAGPLLCPGYDAPPDAKALGSVASPRILQLLLQLERAPEWPSAKGLLLELDRESRAELPILPLWQIEDHYAWRTRLKGPAEVADHLYQGIETWEIEPWYAH